MATNAPQLSVYTPDLERLNSLFLRQKEAFSGTSVPTAHERREYLQRLIDVIRENREKLVAAVASDFGHRSADETLTAEVIVSLQALRYARRNVRRWMRPERARVGMFMAGTTAKTVRQPKGVVGIVAPWNYPLLMVIAPLAYAMAAGNRVMIKPSEFTPTTSELIRQLFESVFSDDHIAVVTGESEMGIAFSQLPFDHLLFTGSTGVGRHVMQAAAANLTPVTLELGGKSPTIISPATDLEMAAERICFGKMLNAGQTCTAPDYLLCPRELQQPLIDAIADVAARMYPTVANNDDYSSIVNDRHYERLQGLLHDARTKEAKVIEINPAAEDFSSTRKMPLQVVLNVHDDMQIMQEEIFGPLLPIVPCETVEEAIDYINARPRPLALNLFSNRKSEIEAVLNRTRSGGLSINDTVTYVGVTDLPFGGVGESGMGRYNGRAGFETFSNARGVFRRPRRLNIARAIYPPYGGRILRLLQRFFLR